MTEDDPRAIAIVAAIRSGDIDALQRQLREDPELANARIVDECGVQRTLLHIVADWPGHFPNAARTAAILIEAGADVNARVDAGETPLHWAASSDDVELLDALLDAEADIEANGAVFTGGAPMSDAVVFAQWNAARRLLQRGAQTTLWQSAALGLIERVQDLFDHDPPPSAEETTNALWHACRGGQRDLAEFLLARGADAHWVGHQGKTPLQVARESGNEELIAWLRANMECGRESCRFRM